jgi:GalNAc-alpha-(1->4)-GalNAc-alpha-(1->3)-diNAcBac-PP-undecaprenol alpha-1,4-N-acetyl-D-galactosaminyltransferase
MLELDSTQQDPGHSAKRILLFIHSMNGGGSERQMSYLANELANRYRVRLVTLDSMKSASYFINPRVECIGLGLTGSSTGTLSAIFSNRKRIRALRDQIQDWNANAVVSFCDSNNILALLATPKKVPVVISERSDPRKQPLSRFWEFLRRRTYPKCSLCVAQTKEVCDYFQETQWVPHNRLRIIPSAFVPPILVQDQIDRERARRSPKVLIFVGRLSKEKGIDRLLQAWANLKYHHTDWRLRIVGDGAERSALQQTSDQLGIASTVEWALWSKDVWAELCAANAYCLVSRYEGFPQSLLEAMATGLAVAVTDCSPAIRETITDLDNGIVISDDTQMVDCLDRLLSSQELRQSLGSRARERAKDFQWNQIASKWHAAIETAMR